MVFFTDTSGQAIIDAEITKLQAAIYALRAQRNSLNAFHNLPSEILSLIFVYYKTQTAFDWRRGTWLNALQVCRRWRNVILNTSRFWATLSLFDAPFVDTMLTRSKGLSINVCYSLNKTRSAPNLEDLCNALAIGLSKTHATIDKLCFRTSEAQGYLVKGTFNRLDNTSTQTLKIESSTNVAKTGIVTIFAALPWEKLTSLRRIELTNVLTACVAPDIPSLTSLRVSCSCYAAGSGLSLKWIAKFLQGTPNLEEIEIGDIDYSKSFPNFDHSELPLAISLPKLRTLTVTGQHISTAKLFDCLSIPSSTRVKATFSSMRGHLEPGTTHIPSLQSLVSQLLPSSADGTIQKMVIDLSPCDTWRCLKLHFSGDNSPFLQFNLPSHFASLRECVQLYSAFAPLAQVLEFSIDDTPRTLVNTALVWSDVLPSFERLKALTVGTHDASSLPLMLQGNTEDKDEANPCVRLPDLEAITITLTDLTSLNVHQLAIYFTDRLTRGRPIRRLVIKGCKIGEELVGALREYVTVEWDGMM
ncbi:hypothetical protein ONZ45_g6616 [Pleurotus djamor]|nr:hypothetical protein ONZ45_g6616 [Pleurotus djamor]